MGRTQRRKVLLGNGGWEEQQWTAALPYPLVRPFRSGAPSLWVSVKLASKIARRTHTGHVRTRFSHWLFMCVNQVKSKGEVLLSTSATPLFPFGPCVAKSHSIRSACPSLATQVSQPSKHVVLQEGLNSDVLPLFWGAAKPSHILTSKRGENKIKPHGSRMEGSRADSEILAVGEKHYGTKSGCEHPGTKRTKGKELRRREGVDEQVGKELVISGSGMKLYTRAIQNFEKFKLS